MEQKKKFLSGQAIANIILFVGVVATIFGILEQGNRIEKQNKKIDEQNRQIDSINYQIYALEFQPRLKIIDGTSGIQWKIAGGEVNNKLNYFLNQNYPNPFNPTTSIRYQIKEKGFVSLKVYDTLGKLVADLVNETKEPGQYSVTFDATKLPSGIYIYSLRVNDFLQNQKMTLLK